MELLQVLFSLNESRKQRPLPGHVVISPVETAWNDFGYKIRCEFKVCVSNKARIIEGSMLIGFLFLLKNLVMRIKISFMKKKKRYPNI